MAWENNLKQPSSSSTVLEKMGKSKGHISSYGHFSSRMLSSFSIFLLYNFENSRIRPRWWQYCSSMLEKCLFFAVKSRFVSHWIVTNLISCKAPSINTSDLSWSIAPVRPNRVELRLPNNVSCRSTIGGEKALLPTILIMLTISLGLDPVHIWI